MARLSFMLPAALAVLGLAACAKSLPTPQVQQPDDVYMTCRQLVDGMREMKDAAAEQKWKNREFANYALDRRNHLRQVYLKKGCNNHDYWLDDVAR